jgi:hypothetical protein
VTAKPMSTKHTGGKSGGCGSKAVELTSGDPPACHGMVTEDGVVQMTKELATYLRGWKSYFGFSQTPSVLRRLEEWIRRRLRSVIWKQWECGKVRYVRLRQRNIGHDLAAQTAGSPHGPWRLGQQPGFAVLTSDCLFRFVRSSSVAGRTLAQPNGTPVYGPACTVVWQVVSRRRASVMLYER